MTRILICGGRDPDYATLDAVEIWIRQNVHSGDTVIHGGARGVDTAAGDAASRIQGVEVLEFPADWDRWGKFAGSIRNTHMLREGKPDLVVAFKGGKGTKNMVGQATDAGVRVIRPQSDTLFG